MCCQAILAQANFDSSDFKSFSNVFLGVLRVKPFWLKAKWLDPENDLSPHWQVWRESKRLCIKMV